MFCEERDEVNVGERVLETWGQLNAIVASLEEEDG